MYCSELLAARAVFIEGARAFLDFSTQDAHSREEGIYCNCALWWPGGIGQLSFCSRGGGGMWVGVEVCVRGGGVWDSTGNGTVGWHVMCCHAPLCLSKQAAFTFLVFVLISPVECHPATQCVCTDRFKCVDIHFRCKANHFPDCAEGSEEKNCNITGKTVSAVVCWSWHCWVCCSAAIAVSLSTGSLVVPTQSYLSVGVCVCDSCHCCECDSALHSCTIPTLQRHLSQRCLPQAPPATGSG